MSKNMKSRYVFTTEAEWRAQQMDWESGVPGFDKNYGTAEDIPPASVDGELSGKDQPNAAPYHQGNNVDDKFPSMGPHVLFPDISADRWETDDIWPGQHLEKPLPPAYAGNGTGLQASQEAYAAKTQKHVGGWSNGDMTDL